MTGLADAVVTARHLARRLRRSHDWLLPHLPLDAERLARFDEDDFDRLDAFLLRFENLTNHLQESVFRRIVSEIEERDPTRMSRRDIAELMDRRRFTPSATAFREAGKVRNILSHVYPDDSAVSAAVINRAAAAAPTLLDTVAMLPDAG